MPDEPTTQESVEGQSDDESRGIEFVETEPEERKPGLEEAFAEMGDEADAAAADDDVQPAVDEQPTAEAEDTPEGEEPTAPEAVRYRDPESGQFISAEEAEARGLDPESLTTEAEAAEEFFEGEDEPDDVPEGESLRFEVPGEDEEAETVAYELEGLSPEARDYLQTQLNRAGQVTELEERRAEIEEARRDVDERLQTLTTIEEKLEVDPVGFMVDEIPDQRRAEVAVDLLLQSDDVFDHVVEKLNEWERNPEKRETERWKREAKREKETRSTQQQRDAQRRRMERAREITAELESYVPDSMSPAVKRQFMQDASRDLMAYLRENPMEPDEFELDAIPRLLEHRFDLYGIDASARRNGARENGVRRSEPADEQTEDMVARAERARQTGERLRKARARKVDAASTAPAGAGSVPDAGRPGPDATLEDALDYARETGV